MNRTERAALKRVRALLERADLGFWSNITPRTAIHLRALTSLAEQADELRREVVKDHHAACICKWCAPRRGKARRR